MKSNWSPLVLTRVGLAAVVAALLLACGGESSAPPAPPTPPPFQPQTVVVQLGSKGGATTLISTQAGGWTRNGQPFTSGSEVTGENAAKYTLTLANGRWTAEFVPPAPVPLALGTSGDAVSLQAQEDGSFQLDGKALTSGTVVDAKNGNQYRLVVGSGGDWMAEFVPPAPQPVTLGTSGESRQIGRLEDGSFTLDGQPLASGTEVQAQNENRYTLTLGSDGTWSATYVQPAPQLVPLGTTGDAPLQVYRQENGTYRLNDEPLLGGRVVTASNGQSYRLSLGTNRRWQAVYQPSSVPVRLGTSGGTVNLTRNEDGTWMRGSTTFSSGDTITGSNGFEYRLTLGSDGWIVEALPATISVTVVGADTTLELARWEDGSYTYDGREVISGHEVEADGNTYRLRFSNRRWTATFLRGEVVVSLGSAGDTITLVKKADGTYELNGVRVRNASLVRSPNTGIRYRLRLSNGVWTSSVYVPPTTDPGDGGGGGTDPVVAAENILEALPSSIVENGAFKSGANAIQAGVADPTNSNGVGIDYSLYGGSGSYEDDTFVASALRAINKILEPIESKGLEGQRDAEVAVRALIDGRWGQVKTELDAIFKTATAANLIQAEPPKSAGETNITRALRILRDLREGLSSVDGFQREFKTQIDAAIDENSTVTGERLFNARKRILALGASSNTRYGVIATLNDSTKKAEDVAGTATGSLKDLYNSNVFAFSRLSATLTDSLPSRGTARYTGRTWAIGDDLVLYAGSIELLASIGIERVTATVSNLRRSDNNASWMRGNREVREIQLPVVGKAEFDNSNGSFTSARTSKVVYEEFGGLFSDDVDDSSHKGQFVGSGQSAGTAVIGTWNVDDGALKGSYGAERSTINRVTFPSSSSAVTYEHDPTSDVTFDKTNKTVAVDDFSGGDPFSLSTLSPSTKSAGTLRATIRLGKTSFTGFGIWKLVETNNDPDTFTTGVFAYSSLAQATYNDVDETYYPGRVRAQYAGKTMAIDGNGTMHSGSYVLNVTWNSSGDVGGTLTAAISSLSAVSGSSRFTIGGKGVSQIGFQGTISDTPAFSSPSNTTVKYTDNTTETLSGQTHSGFFVGQNGIDGPYGVVGNWQVEKSSDLIKGAFGADLVRAP